MRRWLVQAAIRSTSTLICSREHIPSDCFICIFPATIWPSSIRGRGTVLTALHSLRKCFPNFNLASPACVLWGSDVRSGAVFHHLPCASWMLRLSRHKCTNVKEAEDGTNQLGSALSRQPDCCDHHVRH